MKTSLLVTAIAAAASAGCASSAKLDFREYAGEPIRSFWMSDYQGWAPVADHQLVIWTGRDEAYLLTVKGYCPGVKFAYSVAVTSSGGTVDNHERVIVGDNRCMIDEIRPIDTRQMKEDRKLIYEQRKQAKQPKEQS